MPNPEDEWTEESALTPTEDGYEVAQAPPLDPVYARRTADDLAALLIELEAGSEGRIRVVRTAGELESCLRDGVLAAVLHFEGAENLGPDAGALEDLYEKGSDRRLLHPPLALRRGELQAREPEPRPLAPQGHAPIRVGMAAYLVAFALAFVSVAASLILIDLLP